MSNNVYLHVQVLLNQYFLIICVTMIVQPLCFLARNKAFLIVPILVLENLSLLLKINVSKNVTPPWSLLINLASIIVNIPAIHQSISTFIQADYAKLSAHSHYQLE